MNRFFIIFFNVIIFISPLKVILNIYYYLVLFILSLWILKKVKYLLYSLILAIALLLLFEPEKAVLASLIFFASFRCYSEKTKQVLIASYILLTINLILTLFQLLGISDLVYIYVDYANKSMPTSVIMNEAVSIFLPQIRPSGIFPAPTYMSYFLIYIFSITLFYSGLIIPIFSIFTGILICISGSTIGLCIFICYLFMTLFSNNKFNYQIISYLIVAALYFYIMPNYFFYNYSFSDFYTSIFDRNLDESILINNIFVFIIMLFILLLFLIKNKNSLNKIFNLEFMAGGILILLPPLLHDSTNSLIGFYFVGAALGMINQSILKKSIKIIKG